MPRKSKHITPEKEPVHRGYNEKNPGNPQGAYPPDSEASPEKPPEKKLVKPKKSR